jgi:hypothetical protein
MMIEHAATRCTCTGDNPCDFMGCTLYHPPPDGDGWCMVKEFTDTCGARCVLWRRLYLAKIEVDRG